MEIAAPVDSEVKPFRINVSDDVLEDLRRRLRNTRWPDAQVVDDWSQGVPLDWIRDICAYWAEQYDWRARESILNRHDQFMTKVDGLDLHFVHVRSPHANAMPIVLTHGWPGSVTEFFKMIDLLTNPTAHGGTAADAFHVVCPSLPGFGFSAKPRITGWNVDRIATAWTALMLRLGYRRFAAHGGDWGSAVTRSLAAHHAQHCIGIHLTLALGTRPRALDIPTSEETRALQEIKLYREGGSGYARLQATRPQTVGYGLTDSPSGQAAWILEKFYEWSDCDGCLENYLNRDDLLDNVMMYWVSGSAASSARLYWESAKSAARAATKITVPTAVAVFPREIVRPVRRWMEMEFADIRQWTEMPRGGHFAAFEQPHLLAEDLRSFFGTLH